MYEIRNYYYEPTKMVEYRQWASDFAVPYIRQAVDLVGFWITNDEPVQISGAPMGSQSDDLHPLRQIAGNFECALTN